MERFGSPVPEGSTLGVPISQPELGSMVGASREMVNKCLRKLTAGHVVRYRAKVLIVIRSAGSPALGKEPVTG